VSRITLAASLLLLAACAAKPPVSTAFRAADAPIWSAAAFQPSQAAGTWQQVADFRADGADCGEGAIKITPEAGGLRLNGSLCLAGVARDVSALALPSGPGRLSVAGEEWWILWVDTGYRTMAIGTPSGRFGFILDRGAIPGDRLTAAREIFDFNGYRTAALAPM
jgi:apolipoprotein D and lipocalin family protein